jgi:hypothetical protein
MNSQLNTGVARARAFIANSELADGALSLMDTLADSKVTLDSPQPEPASAAVTGSNLLVFTESVSRQNREDVMDSYLFATLVANKAFNPETQSEQWYAKFNEVLSKVGWLSSNWSYSRYRSTDRSFTMDKAGLQILGSAIAAAALPGPASAAMLKVAADAVQTLAARDQPLQLFERQTRSHSGANFRLGACLESSDGTISLAMGAVNFQADAAFSNVLFWEWNSAEVQTFRGESNLVLNSSLYATVRAAIRKRLGNNAEAAIAEFDI